MPRYRENQWQRAAQGFGQGAQAVMNLGQIFMQVQRFQQQAKLAEEAQKIAAQKAGIDARNSSLQALDYADTHPGKLSDLIKVQELQKFGFPEEEAKILAKEDAEKVANIYRPAFDYLQKKFPNMTIDEAKAYFARAGTAGRQKIVEEAATAAQEEQVQAARQQIAPPSQEGGPQLVQAAPPSMADRLDMRINALDREKQGLQAEWDRVNALNVSPKVKKSALDDIKAQMNQKHTAFTEAMSIKSSMLREQGMETQAQQFEQRMGQQQGQFEQRMGQQAAQFQQGLANQGAALIQAQQAAKQNAPLDVAATRWIHPETLQTASPDMSPAEAKAAGFSVITPSLSQAIPSARTALKSLERYKELSDKLLVDTTDMDSASAVAAIQANRAKLKVKEYAGDPEVAEFIALGATLPSQVKAFGDTGNIAVKETEFAGKAMPNLSDSKQGAARKVESRTSLLKQVIRSSVSTASRKAQVGQGEAAATGTKPKTAEDFLKKYQ